MPNEIPRLTERLSAFRYRRRTLLGLAVRPLVIQRYTCVSGDVGEPVAVLVHKPVEMVEIATDEGATTPDLRCDCKIQVFLRKVRSVHIHNVSRRKSGIYGADVDDPAPVYGPSIPLTRRMFVPQTAQST